MNDITERGIDAMRRSIRDSFREDVYRQHLRASARRYQPVSVEIEPTIHQPTYAELKAARDLLEASGFTVVPNHRLGAVSAEHRFDWREVDIWQKAGRFDGVVKSVSEGLSGLLGVRLVDEGAATFHDHTGTMDRVIGYTTAVILPK